MNRCEGLNRVLTGATVLFLGMWYTLADTGNRTPDTPAYLVTVPRLAAPPTVDGKLDPHEWAGAAALTGHINCAPGSEGALVIEKQDVTWYVGYDDRFLYIAMDNPLRPGTWPRAQAKGFDDQNLLWDDHIEVTFSPHSRTDAVREGWGFYKLIGNAKGFFSDEHFYNGTPGTEKIWSIGGDYKCHVVEGLWQLEMKIALEAINVKSLDHRSLYMQLVRADHSIGAYFAGIRQDAGCLRLGLPGQRPGRGRAAQRQPGGRARGRTVLAAAARAQGPTGL